MPVSQEGGMSAAVPKTARVSLSVIIPSYNSLHLSKVLEHLQGLAFEEVIVVDSSSQRPALPDTAATLIHLDKRTRPAAARNLGAQRARGDYLLFLDSDVLLPPRSIDWLMAFLEQPSATIVSGMLDSREPQGNFYSRLQIAILRYRILKCRTLESYNTSSSHLLVERQVFQRIGGFNEELRTYEDVEFLARCLHLGHRPLLSEELMGVHLKTYNLWTLLWDYALKSYNAVTARRRYPNVFRGVPFYLGRSLAASWLAGALIPWVAVLTGGMGRFWWSGGLALCGLFLVQARLLVFRVLHEMPLIDRLKALLLWPLLGSTVVAASLMAEIAWFIESLRQGVVSFGDYLRAAKRVLIRNGMPVQIVAYVTSRCNLRCEHCFYKETLDAPDPGELPLAVFDRTTKSIGPVLWFSLGGGEPFIRRDLAQLVQVIQRNCRPKIFTFPTNGWYIEKTFETTLRILQNMNGGSFILFFSLDGPKALHDQIRGPGSFERVKATMERLRPLTKLYPQFYLNVTTTVMEANAHVAADFINELVRDFEPSAISINLFRYHALEHPPIPDYVIEGYRAAVARYERHLREGALKHYGFFGGRVLLFKEILQKDLIYRVAKDQEFVTPCTAGTLSYVIMEDGRVSPCEILPDTIGYATDTKVSFAKMIHTEKARKLRRWIRDTECKCTYECAMSTNTLFSWPMTKRLAKAVIQDRVS